MPQISQFRLAVIIPVYNVEPYLSGCLNSLTAQTFTEWTAFIIDDGSTDNSGKIADDFALHDARFCVCHTANAGLSAARNYGLEMALKEGMFSAITFLDSDDMLYYDAYSTALRHLSLANTDVVCFGWNRLFDDGRVTSAPFIHETGPLSIAEYVSAVFSHRKWRGSNGAWGIVWNKIFKTDCIKSIRFNDKREINEDELFCIEANPGSVFFIAEPFYLYRQREGSLIKTENMPLRLQLGRLLCIEAIKNNSHDSAKHIRIIAEAMLYTMQGIYKDPLRYNKGSHVILKKCASTISSSLSSREMSELPGISRSTLEFVDYLAKARDVA